MIDKLIERLNEQNFRDVFQPLSDDEVFKRGSQEIIDGIYEWTGVDVSEEQLRSVLWAMIMSEDLERNVIQFVNHMRKVYIERRGEEDED